MSIAEGFGGMRVKDNQLHFSPKIPKEWEGYSFKINFRNQIVTVSVSQENTTFSVDGHNALEIVLNGTATTVNPSAVLA
jgi:maltose phosphorylase